MKQIFKNLRGNTWFIVDIIVKCLASRYGKNARYTNTQIRGRQRATEGKSLLI